MRSTGIYFYTSAIAACLLLSCGTSRSFSVSEVDGPPMLPLTKTWNNLYPATAANRFLVFLYGNLKYPKEAREPGVHGCVRADYVITDEGRVVDVKVAEEKSAEPQPRISSLTSDTLVIRAIRTPIVSQDHGTYIPPPIPDYSLSDSLTGHRALLREVERVVGLFPAFLPAELNGKKVQVKKTTWIYFCLEW